MKICLPASVEEHTSNELRIVDAEGEGLCSVINYLEDITPDDHIKAEFFMAAVNTECPFEGDCKHFEPFTGCKALVCDRNVVIDR